MAQVSVCPYCKQEVGNYLDHLKVCPVRNAAFSKVENRKPVVVRGPALPKPGDLVFVKHTDDSLIRQGTWGVITGNEGEVGANYEVTFNYTTPWWTDKHIISASGGPVRIVPVSSLAYIGTKDQVFNYWGGRGIGEGTAEEKTVVVNAWNVDLTEKGEPKTEKGEQEKRKFTIHDREYWFTKDDLQKELGLEPEDVEEVWVSAKEPLTGKKEDTRKEKRQFLFQTSDYEIAMIIRAENENDARSKLAALFKGRYPETAFIKVEEIIGFDYW